MKKYQTLLDQVGRASGIKLTLEEGGICAVQFDEIIINMNFIEDEDQCYFLSALFPIPGNETDKGALFERLLEKNCFFKETMGGILGIDKGLGQVTYGVKFKIGDMPGTDFISRMETFINAAEEFVETLGNTLPPSQDDKAPSKGISAHEFQNMIKI